MAKCGVDNGKQQRTEISANQNPISAFAILSIRTTIIGTKGCGNLCVSLSSADPEQKAQPSMRAVQYRHALSNATLFPTGDEL